MALFAGDVRQATVVAKTDVECYRLDRASVQGLLLSRPQIAEHVSRIVGSRRSSIDQAQEAYAATATSTPAEREVDLLKRIRRFFGIERTS